MSLPSDSAERKRRPLYRGCLQLFPDALAGVALQSMKSMEQHSLPDLVHDRSKSGDHLDCLLRHTLDMSALLAAYDRNTENEAEHVAEAQAILAEVNAMAWRVLAFSQELHEDLMNEPLAPGAV